MKVRIGIDVGGTFTDAVVIDDSTYKLIGTWKIPTSHDSEEGVARGIVDVITGVMAKYSIKAEDVSFIAHGTTQATNALLEGDVVPVGIIGMGHGLEGIKAKQDTQVGKIELAPQRYLYTRHCYLDTAKDTDFAAAIDKLRAEGSEAIVVSAAFSVDDPSSEIAAMEKVREAGMVGTASCEISKLYGLKIRTRTAAINASILPKMLEAANMTENSVKNAGIRAPLMIMRCDGGLMDINEVRKRPILTMLSGPAAGVAGALMYEKISEGLFLEVGGTSTDISAVKNGRVMVDYAEVGGHKTYLNSLDVRTVGIAGGSMVQFDGKKVVDVGPRSAHIAGLHYAVYAKAQDMNDAELEMIQPKAGDPHNYVAVRCSNGSRYAVTVSCAANVLGYVQNGDYAYGDREAARLALKPLANRAGVTVEAIAKEIMDMASLKNAAVVKKLLTDYKMDIDQVVLVGGGGGAAAVVPYLAEFLGCKHKIAKNSEVISPIGVALAMVREVVERTVLNPTAEDILRVRKEAEQAALNSGAAAGTVELTAEVDAARNLVRVIAVGATELRTKEMGQQRLDEATLKSVAAKAMGLEEETVTLLAATSDLYVWQGECRKKRLWGLLKSTKHLLRVVDSEGVVRMQKNQGIICKLSMDNFADELSAVVEEATVYNDGGKEVPDVFLLYGKKIVDFSGLTDKKQIAAVAEPEVAGLQDDETVLALLCSKSAGRS